MQVIAVFIVFSAVLDAIAVGICSFLERVSENVSLIAFLGLFVVNFIIAWHLAVYVVERYFVTNAQKRHHQDHMQWVNSLFVPARR